MTTSPPAMASHQAVATRSAALVFRVWLALAVLFHLAGNPALGDGPRSAWLIVVQAVVGLLAVWLLVDRRRQLPLLLLCVAVPASAWLEAPVVGNHWILAAALCMAYLTSAGVVLWRRESVGQAWSVFAPVGRLVLLIAYAFAAFAKLNTDFLDPSVSCAVFYQDQLVSSWGLPMLSVEGDELLGRAVAVAAVCVELSVPLLLLLPWTRRWGVLLAMSFHWFLALDLAQHFWDFSSILFVGFLLFLDRDQVAALTARVLRLKDAIRPSVRTVLAAGGLGVALVAVGAGALGHPVALRVVAVLTAHLAWWVLGTATLVLVALTVLRVHRPRPGLVSLASPVLLVVPILVLLNGLSPYLELKTGFGWNMYSNLRTVAGETNHLVVPATWDTTGAQVERVTVLESTDERLLSRPDVELVWSEFREYAVDHPDETVTYRRGGETYSAPTLGDDPAGQGAVGVLQRRLLSFRAVDVSGDERCLDVFGPAR